MFFDDRQFSTDLVQVNDVRYVLFTKLYSNMDCIQQLSNIISERIDCLGIEYNPNTFSFVIKIKKTAMRKNFKFSNQPTFYYGLIPDIFMMFIKNNEQAVLDGLKENYEDPNSVLAYIYSNPGIMGNLCHVSCISDNIVVFKL